MAVRHGYGKIAGTDALVFAYDTGDTRNSYKGEPTTNYGPANFGSWGTEGTAQRIATGNNHQGQPTYNCRTTVGASWHGIDTTIAGLRTAAGSSGTVTMSCMVRNNNPSSYPMYAYIGHDFSSTRTIAANSDWQKVQWTVNQSSMNSDYVEFRPYTNNASLYLEMTMPMVEVNQGHATQFTTGTRSATQGLIDLTGNSTIDLSNVSFDSNAQMTFDGTDDYTGVSHANSPITNLTYELVVRIDSIPASNTFRSIWQKSATWNGNTGISMQMIYGNLTFSYGNNWGGTVQYPLSNLTVGNWYHIVGTADSTAGTDVRFYINGVLVDTGTSSQTPTTTSDLTIGQGNGGTFDGRIDIFKMYSRTLTADEIRNNYRHYKNRFNIS